jgi:hypothetical protein
MLDYRGIRGHQHGAPLGMKNGVETETTGLDSRLQKECKEIGERRRIGNMRSEHHQHGGLCDGVRTGRC